MEKHILRFEPNGLHASDMNLEDVRLALGLPKIEERKVVYGDFGDWRMTEAHKALVNAETGQLYGIHSAGYRTVNHEAGILAVMEVVEQIPEFGAIEWTVSSHKDYQRMLARGRFTDITREVVSGDQGINPVIDYSNSYDGSWAEKLMFGAHRLVCTNGMVALEILAHGSVPHLGVDRPEEFLGQLSSVMDTFSRHHEIWKRWSDQPLLIPHVESVVETLPTKDRDSILETVEYGDMSLWDFYNVVTARVTHDMPSLNKQIKTWNRLQKISARW